MLKYFKWYTVPCLHTYIKGALMVIVGGEHGSTNPLVVAVTFNLAY